MKNRSNINILLNGFNIVIASYLMLFFTSIFFVIISQNMYFLNEIRNKYIVLYTQIALPMTISLIILPLIFEIFVYKNDRKSLGFILLNSSNKYNFCIYLITLFIYIAIIFSNINDFRNVLLLSVYVFIQCFGEEILFRSVIQRRLQLVMNSKWAIIFGTLIFVFLFHEDTMLNNLLFRTPIAIVLSYTFYKTKSIYPTTLIHFVYNLYYSI
ncbi:CPBP family intramembrane glutamic endopeptidase [Staphylococcus agnetis]|uniref:CAAX prenyl protease 2/Lysostaphin resistance protein A-like domain-containing protein n=2 Tax=Staphylococcus agnetis TaxID=985762 RepID=A0ABX3YZ85_9STAP|nr:hypothetical protein B9M87_12390 [Staphylococcus agnetis]OSP22704.1 hypothetical protein B9L42_00025 [Staphylococcus agnetis]OTW29956.1 hypothetical protein B9M88_12530 [Staphylococcus agnetis]